MVGLSQGRSREGGPKAGHGEQREAQGARPGFRLVGSEKKYSRICVPSKPASIT